jgi:hypothetical protein
MSFGVNTALRLLVVMAKHHAVVALWKFANATDQGRKPLDARDCPLAV